MENSRNKQYISFKLHALWVSRWNLGCLALSSSGREPFLCSVYPHCMYYVTVGHLVDVSVIRATISSWPKSPFSFFCKIKDTFFIFTNHFNYLDILSMLAISCYWLLVGRGQGYCLTSSNAQDSPTAKNHLAKMSIVPRNFANHFGYVQSVTLPSLYTVWIFLCVLGRTGFHRITRAGQEWC